MIQDIAPHRYDVAYRTPEAGENDRMLIYNKGGLLCRMEEDSVSYPSVGTIAEIYPDIYKEAAFLFRIDDRNYFGLLNEKICPMENYIFLPKEKLRNVRPIWKAFAGITGFQLHNWYAANRYCSFCRAKMRHHGRERALVCPDCGKTIYPQICPSVIVGVINKDRILMTKYAQNHSKFKKYALVAGYAEVGESLEDTVRREVMEEVGLKVKNIRYYKSQPWSFTDTLLTGFFCDVDGSPEIKMDEEELSAAEWFGRDEIPPERSEAEVSLTGEMIDAFSKNQI